ncbi:hypothetical protein Tsubulata_014186 [Turnera subulata]|uniref:Hexosyltransferase n=1 Tax=Turnera subulata TaxID=218843 RepID=A0A9Q0FI25_9ROSI|nr:hypothetical protein Tsubulata_014186 [Turnera subulata]
MVQKPRTTTPTLNAIKQEADEGVKEPNLIVYAKDWGSAITYRSSIVSAGSKQSGNSDVNVGQKSNLSEGINHERKEEILQKQERVLSQTVEKEKSYQATLKRGDKVRPPVSRVADEKVKQIKDALIRAKAYINLAPPGCNSHLVKELRQRIKELERATGEASKESELSKSAIQKMKSMEIILLKADRVYPDCSAMASKLRAMTYNAEEQVRAHKNQAAYLVQLAARTTPKGLHCLSMRLTAEYFALPPEERQLPNQQRVHDPNLYHYAVFSDNVLACAVVVNSTVSSATEAEKIVFHVVTNSLNLPAISMWFLLNPPGKATIQIQSIEKFEDLLTKNNSSLKMLNSVDPRYTSALNHLRFYLPDVFPLLKKIVLFDHDVVVQRDLTGLWSIDMRGKVNGAVETCHQSEASFRRMDMFINFSDPYVSKRFDLRACTWAFGMNLFDLQEWRRQNLTGLYHRYLQMGYKRPLWTAGSLPLGWVTFYNKTVALDRRWHRLGLGYESGVGRDLIERAAVLHYDGVMKPWLDIGIGKYKDYWSKHINFDHTYLQQCNIHG